MKKDLITKFVKEAKAHINNIINEIDGLENVTTARELIMRLNYIHSAADCIVELIDGEYLVDGEDGYLKKLL